MKRSIDDVDADVEDVNNADSSKDQCIQDTDEDNIQCNNDVIKTGQCFYEDIIKEHGDVSDEINESSSSSELDAEQAPIIPLHVIHSCVKYKIDKPESSKICHILSSYCSDKLKDVLTSAIKYKARWNRKKLTAGDFNKGLFFCGEKPLCEFPDIPLFKKEKQKKKKRRVASNIEPCGILSSKLKTTVSVSKAWLGKEHSSSDIQSSNLPEELKLYFTLVTKDLLNLEKESLALVLEDLKLNKNISSLVPFFIDFLISKIDELSQSDLPKFSVVLRATDSLIANPCLCFREDSCLKNLSHTLIKCLLDPLQYYLDGDFWLLKDTVAELLASVLKRSKSEALTFEILFFLEAALCDTELTFISHYGAVAAVNSIGVPAVNLVIIPHIDTYLTYLNSVKMDSSIGFPEKYHAYAVQGQLNHSYYLLTQHFLKYEFEECNFHSGGFLSVSESLLKTRIPASLRDSFTEYFGDALVQCFPLWNFVSCNVNTKKRNQGLVKNLARKLKDFENTNRELSETMIVNNSNTADKVRASMFDYHPIKKCVIKFGKIMKNNML